MRARLIGMEGILDGETQALSTGEECIVGRSETASLPLLDNRVSREHARFRFDSGFFVVEDMESRNGIWVNGKKVTRAILFHGDHIVIGSQEFRFELEDDAGGPDKPELHASDEVDDYVTAYKESVPQDETGAIAGLERPDDPAAVVDELERQLSAMCNIIRVVHSEEHLDLLFRKIMDHVMHVSDADRGHLFSGAHLGGVIAPQVSRYKDAGMRRARSSFSRSVVTDCYQEGASTLLADPRDPGTSPSESIIQQNIASVLCVPMMCDEGPVGVIYVDKLRGSRKFTKRDLRLLSAVGRQGGIAVRRAQLARQVERLFSDCILTLVSIIEAKDEYTRGHSERVTEVALRLAEAAGLDAPAVRDLRLAGLLHDVGKIAVQTDVLRKPDKLSQSEFLSVQQHTTRGAQIVSSIENADHIAAAVRHHHEKWDGSGYPDHLVGEDIPLMARILCIADCYDAMASNRPYRDAMPHEQVLAEVERCSGTQFDPGLARVFVDSFSQNRGFESTLARFYAKAGELGAPATN